MMLANRSLDEGGFFALLRMMAIMVGIGRIEIPSS
jgi:hypothetical protein